MIDSLCFTSARVSRLLLAALTLILAAGGCGGEFGTPIGSVHPVKGQVLLPDGKPLSAGQVVLVSRADAREYHGKLDSDGRFTVKTGDREGTPTGSYKVRIDPEATQSQGRGKKSSAAIPFPIRYADETTSELEVSVKEGENSLEPFKLTKAPASSKASRDDSSKD